MIIYATKWYNKWIFAILPKDTIAVTIGIYIFSKFDYINQSTLDHEMVHVKQFKKDPWLFWVKYIFNRNCRLKYEIEAYKVQIISGFYSIDVVVDYLSDNYWLNYSKDYIKNKILEIL
jgi:hypothetical protein